MKIKKVFSISLILIMLILLSYFVVPVKYVIPGCPMYGEPDKIIYMTLYKQFKKEYLVWPTKENPWDFYPRRGTVCV